MRSELTWIEISKEALLHNARTVKKIIGARSLYAVVKSNAYGHGTEQTIKILGRDVSVDGFAVASLEEALDVITRTKKPVVILSFWQRDRKLVRTALRKGIRFPVYDIRSARWLAAQARAIGVRARAHLKIDVGTLRLGIRFDDHAQLVPFFGIPGLSIESVFSHFADSESKSDRFTRSQYERFEAICSFLTGKGYRFTRHIACSAAALRSSRYLADAIRLGIALYGLWPSPETRKAVKPSIGLKPAFIWKTRIIQVKDIQKGERVGYGLTYRMSKNTRIAVLPVGYWDGYDRRLSNTGTVLIGGVRCPVRGRICMNVMMVEIPLHRTVQPGDEAVLIGRQGRSEVSVDELARLCQTINYEIVTRINPRISRRVTGSL